jgi:hypothetical protein
VPLQPKEVDGHARFVCFASDFNFCLSWQNFKVVFLNDGGELGPRPLSQERETTRCVDLNKNPDNFFQHPGGSMGPRVSGGPWLVETQRRQGIFFLVGQK